MEASLKPFILLSNTRETSGDKHHRTPLGNCLKGIQHESVKWKLLLWGAWLLNHVHAWTLSLGGLGWARERRLLEDSLFRVWLCGWELNVWQWEHGDSWLSTGRVHLSESTEMSGRLIQWTFIVHLQWEKTIFVKRERIEISEPKS